MDWCGWLGKQVRLFQVLLNRLNIVDVIAMITLLVVFVLLHVLSNGVGVSCRLRVMIKVCMFLLGVLHAFNQAFDSALLLQDVEAHLEDVVHFELIAEAFFLQVCVNVA